MIRMNLHVFIFVYHNVLCLRRVTIVQIIFHFPCDDWTYCGIFENGVLLMYTLEGVSSVANFIAAYEESQ